MAFALTIALSLLVRPAGADTDTLVVTPPPLPAPLAPIPTRTALGLDGVWYPVPMTAVSPAAALGPGVFSASLPRVLDIGARQGHTIVFDPVRQSFVEFGGTVQPGGLLFNDVWERPLSSTGEWTPLAVNGTPPSPRSDHSAVYDPISDRMLVFGGASPLQNDVWELTFAGTPQWNRLTPTGTPPTPRSGHTAVFDATRNQMIVFGGQTPTVSNETWVLDLSGATPAWRLVSAGTPPPGRAKHVAILDTNHDQMVVYGGVGASFYDDVWTMVLGATPTWTLRSSASPHGWRSGASAVVDPLADQMLLFGGVHSGTFTNDLWRLDLTTMSWSLIPTSSPPPPRSDAAMAMDPVTRVAVVQGGELGTTTYADTWSLAMAPSPAWTQLVSPPPPPPPPPPPSSPPLALRYGTAGFFDAARGRFLMTGGAYDESHFVNIIGDIAELTLGSDSTWTSLATGAQFARLGHSAVYDPRRDRIIIFGGYDRVFLNDLWEVRLSPTLSSARLDALGTPPSTRDFAAAIYDPGSDRILYFGGNHDGTFLNDLWELTLSGTPTWQPVVAAGTPPSPRFAHSGVLDPIGNQMLVFGGYSTGSLNDLWSLSLGSSPAWTELSPSGSPPAPRAAHTLQYDPNRHRMVLLGGRQLENGRVFGDIWALSLGGGAPQWQQLAPTVGVPANAGPVPRYGQLALIDPADDRMLVSGGVNSDINTLQDVWRLQWSLDPTPTTMSLVSSDARFDEVDLRWGLSGDGTALCRLERKDPTSDWRTIDASTGSAFVVFHDRAVTPGARYGYRLDVVDASGETRSADVWIDVPSRPELALDGFSPNPATSRPRIAFSLPESSPATIELFDVSGRRLARRVLGAPAVGASTVELAPDGTLTPGLYFVRLTQGTRSLVRRGTVVR